MRVLRSPDPDKQEVKADTPTVVTEVLSTRFSAEFEYGSGLYGGRAAVITVEVAMGTFYGGSFTFSREDYTAFFTPNEQWFKDSVAGNANSPLGEIPQWEGTVGVPAAVPDACEPSVVDPPLPKGGMLAGGTWVKDFTMRLVGNIEEVIVLQSLSLIGILITVATKAMRPGPVGVNAVLQPREPVLQDVLSVAGTAHTVCPLSSVVREGGGGMAVVKEGLDALPAPMGVPSVAELQVTSFALDTDDPTSTVLSG